MQLVLNIALNIFLMLSGYLALIRFYPKNNNMRWIKACVLFALIVGQAFISYFEKPYLNSLTMIITLIAMTKMMFECKKITFLLYDTFIAVSYFISDLISNFTTSIITQNTVYATLQYNDLVIPRYILNVILVFMICNLMSAVFRQKRNESVHLYEVTSYILITVFEASSAAYIAHHIQQFSSGTFLIIFLLGCLILDVYIVFVFYKLAEGRKIEKEFYLIQQQSKIQLDVYRELSDKYKNSMKIVHDAKKHINAIEGLIESEKAKEYKESLYLELNKLCPEFHDNNQMLMVIVNHALFKAEKSKINLKLHIEEIDLSFITDMDLTTIFVNLLDNAIEACQTMAEDKRRIDLHAERRMGFIIIQISNPYEFIYMITDKKYYSTKSGHAGVGLSNVCQTVEKYKGLFNIETINEIFTVEITIPENM